MVPENTTLLANPDIVFREEDEGAFLFDPDTGALKCLNAIGGTIWRLCDGTRTTRDLLGEMAEQYPDVPPERLQDDLVKFLEELCDIGYLGSEWADEDEENESSPPEKRSP